MYSGTDIVIATAIIVAFLATIFGLLYLCVKRPSGACADWKGRLQRRFVLHRMRSEWGRWCYQTNCCGETRNVWWEHDPTIKE